MGDGFDGGEDELRHRQGGRLYPVGRSLRATFPTSDGADLQPRITSLMVELAHQPYDERSMPGLSQSPAPPARDEAAPAPSFLTYLVRLFRRDA